MDARRGEELEAVRRRMGLELSDLWLVYIGLGGKALPNEMETYLRGAGTFSQLEHDVLAQAINEHAIDQGMDHPAPYERPSGESAER